MGSRDTHPLYVVRDSDPTVNHDKSRGFAIGSRWLNETTLLEFVCFDNATGAAVWEPGMAFGELWVLANAVATTIVGAGTFAQFVGFANDGQFHNATPDHTNDHITIDRAGVYEVICSFHIESVGGGAADTVSIEIRKNNGTVRFQNLHAHRKLAGGGGDIGSISISGLADLSLNDTIEVWLTNDDNATNLLVADANLTVVQIGA